MSNDSNPTNQINISSITGGVNNIGSQVENQTVVNNFGSQEPASIDQVYEVILRALPPEDKAAIQAAMRLLELEAAARKAAQGTDAGPAGADQDAAVESQTILARYKPQIVAALQEMGLAWLQTAFPMVAFVRPLIKIAIDAWNEAP
jgi:hypothetical protein